MPKTTAADADPTRPPPPMRRRQVPPLLTVIVLCIGCVSGALMQSFVIPLQSSLPHLLDTDPASASWAVTATLLAGSVAMPVAGRLADMVGRKPVLIACTLILLAGSVLSAIFDSLPLFLLGRALQGLSLGYIPVAISLVAQVAPARYRSASIAAVSATIGFGAALGLPIAAWIAQTLPWQMLFWIAALFAALVLAATLRFLPHLHDGRPARFDVVGLIGFATGLTAALIGVSKGSTWGWSAPATLGSIIGGLIVLAVWFGYERRHPTPLVDVRTLARRPVLLTNLAAVLIGFGMMAQSIVAPQLLQLPAATGYGMGQSILSAGMWLAPPGLMMMVFAPRLFGV